MSSKDPKKSKSSFKLFGLFGKKTDEPTQKSKKQLTSSVLIGPSSKTQNDKYDSRKKNLKGDSFILNNDIPEVSVKGGAQIMTTSLNMNEMESSSVASGDLGSFIQFDHFGAKNPVKSAPKITEEVEVKAKINTDSINNNTLISSGLTTPTNWTTSLNGSIIIDDFFSKKDENKDKNLKDSNRSNFSNDPKPNPITPSNNKPQSKLKNQIIIHEEFDNLDFVRDRNMSLLDPNALKKLAEKQNFSALIDYKNKSGMTIPIKNTQPVSKTPANHAETTKLIIPIKSPNEKIESDSNQDQKSNDPKDISVQSTPRKSDNHETLSITTQESYLGNISTEKVFNKNDIFEESATSERILDLQNQALKHKKDYGDEKNTTSQANLVVLGQQEPNNQQITQEAIESKNLGIYPRSQEIAPKIQEIAPKPQEITLKSQEIASKPQEIAPKIQEIASKPQEITPKPQEIVLKSQEITLKPQEIILKSQEITPKPQEIVLKSQEITPKPQEIAPKMQEIIPKIQEKAPVIEPTAKSSDKSNPLAKSTKSLIDQQPNNNNEIQPINDHPIVEPRLSSKEKPDLESTNNGVKIHEQSKVVKLEEPQRRDNSEITSNIQVSPKPESLYEETPEKGKIQPSSETKKIDEIQQLQLHTPQQKSTIQEEKLSKSQNETNKSAQIEIISDHFNNKDEDYINHLIISTDLDVYKKRIDDQRASRRTSVNKMSDEINKETPSKNTNTTKQEIPKSPGLSKLESILKKEKDLIDIDQSQNYQIDLKKEDSYDERIYTEDDFEDPLDKLEREHKRVLTEPLIKRELNFGKIFPVTHYQQQHDQQQQQEQQPQTAYCLNVVDIKEMVNIEEFFNKPNSVDDTADIRSISIIENQTKSLTDLNKSKSLTDITKSKPEITPIGSPNIISMYLNKYVIVGTNTGIVVIFDEEERVLKTIECKEFRGICITALTVSNDFSEIIIGYETGGIAVINIQTKEIMKTITDIHKGTIISLIIYGSFPLKFVSSDNTGIIYITELNQNMLSSTQYTRSSHLLIKKLGIASNKIIALTYLMRNLYSKVAVDNEYLETVFATAFINSVTVVSIKPTPSMIYTLKRPNYIKDMNIIPSITWLLGTYYTQNMTGENKPMPGVYLIIGWGRILHMIEFKYEQKHYKFSYLAHLVLEYDIRIVNAIAQNMLLIVDINNIIYIIHCHQFKKGDYNESINSSNDEMTVTKLDGKFMLRFDILKKYEIVGLKYIKRDGIENTITYYDHTIYGNIDSNILYILTKNMMIIKLHIKNSINCLDEIYKQDSLIKYMIVGLDIIENKIPMIYDIANERKKRLETYVPLITKNIIKYIESDKFISPKNLSQNLDSTTNQPRTENLNNDTDKDDSLKIEQINVEEYIDDNDEEFHVNVDNVIDTDIILHISKDKIESPSSNKTIDSPNDIHKDKEKISTIINGIIDFECQVDNCMALFTDIKNALEKKGHLNNFLKRLEPFIIQNRIKRMPDNMIRDIAKFYCEHNKFEESKHSLVQQLLIKLDLSEADQLSIITICLEFDLDSALFYLLSKFDNNFTFPLIKLLNDIQKATLLSSTKSFIMNHSQNQTPQNIKRLSTSIATGFNVEDDNGDLMLAQDNNTKAYIKTLGYKALWYIKSCLKQTIFFDEKHILNKPLWVSIITQIKLIIFEEVNLRLLMKIDPYITINIIVSFFDNELSTLMIEDEYLKLYNLITSYLDEPQNYSIKRKFEIFLAGKLIQTGHSSFLDEITVYDILQSYLKNVYILDDKIFITYYKFIISYKQQQQQQNTNQMGSITNEITSNNNNNTNVIEQDKAKTHLKKSETSNVSELKKSEISTMSELKKSEISNSNELKKSGISNSNDLKRSEISNSNDLKRSEISNSNDLKRSEISNSSDFKKSMISNKNEVISTNEPISNNNMTIVQNEVDNGDIGLNNKVINKFIKEERYMLLESLIRFCKNILDKNKVLDLFNIITKNDYVKAQSNVNSNSNDIRTTLKRKKSMIKNKKEEIRYKLMIMKYVIDENTSNNENIDEDLLISYIEILCMVKHKHERRKILELLRRFTYYPINTIIEICKKYNVKDAWAYLELKNSNFEQALILSFQVFCEKLKKYFYGKNVYHYKKAQNKLKAKLENIIEILKVITYEYKTFWFDYLNDIYQVLDETRIYMNSLSNEKNQEFILIHDILLDDLINAIINSFTLKEIAFHLPNARSMPSKLIQRLVLKLMTHYSHERKAYIEFTELSMHDYLDIVVKFMLNQAKGIVVNQNCAGCSNPITNLDKMFISFCGHVFHLSTCLEQMACPLCQKSESTILSNISATITSRTNKTAPKQKFIPSVNKDLNKKPEQKMNALNIKKKEEKDRKITMLENFELNQGSRNIGKLLQRKEKNTRG